jgi:putative DNA primase/helicase
MSGDRIISRRKPRQSAKLFRGEQRPHLINQQDEWLDWDGYSYVSVEDATITSEIAEWCDGAYEQFVDEKGKPGTRKFEPKPADVNAITDSLKKLVHRPANQFTAPCWLDSKPKRPDPFDIISCRNGLLDMRTRKLHPQTPSFFTRTAIPIIYDPKAAEPELWFKCLDEWFLERQPLADLLQELFGYSLSADTSQQVVPFLWGVPRGGKGTVARVLTDLVGQDNVHAPSIMELSGRFGLEGCLAMSLITVTDMDVDSKSELGSAAVCINKISGEDRVSVERKNKLPWKGRLPGRVWLIGNNLPDFGSHATAVAARLAILPFECSFLGREDRDLTNVRGTGKLQQELPGILNWALDGLARLRENGRFMDCPESDAAKIRMLQASEPVRGFVEEKCELGDGVHIDKAMLYPRYRAYCKTVGVHPMAANKFGERLHYLYPSIGATKRSASDGSRPPIFDGIRLNEREAAKLYRIADGYIEEDILMFGFDQCAALDGDGEPIPLTTLEADFVD